MGEGAIPTGPASSPPPVTGGTLSAPAGGVSSGPVLPSVPTVIADAPRGSEEVKEAKKEGQKAEAKEVQHWEQAELDRGATSRDVRRVIAQRTVDQLKLQPTEQPRVEDALKNLLENLAPQEVGKSETGKAASSDPTTPQGAADVPTSGQVRGAETAPDSGRSQADAKGHEQKAGPAGDKAPQGEKTAESPLTQLLKNSRIPSDSIKEGLARGNLGVYRATLKNAPLHERAAAHGEVAALVRSLRAALTRSRNTAEQKALQKALFQAKVLAEAVSPQSKEELPAYIQRADSSGQAGEEGQVPSGPAGAKADKPEGGEKVKIFACENAEQAEPGRCQEYANSVDATRSLAQLLSTGSNPSVKQQDIQTNQAATVFVATGKGEQGREDGNNSNKRSRGFLSVKPGEKVKPGEGVVCKLSNLPGTFARVMG